MCQDYVLPRFLSDHNSCPVTGEALGRGFIKFLCRGSVRFFSRAFLVFLMKESKKRRRKQPGKLMAKSSSQLVNLNPLPRYQSEYKLGANWAGMKTCVTILLELDIALCII